MKISLTCEEQGITVHMMEEVSTNSFTSLHDYISVKREETINSKILFALGVS